MGGLSSPRPVGAGGFRTWAPTSKIQLCWFLSCADGWKKIYLKKGLKPAVYVQNDQRVTGIVWSYVCWGTHRPVPPWRLLRSPAGIVSRRTRKTVVEGRGGWKMGSKAPSPPSQPHFLPCPGHPLRGHPCEFRSSGPDPGAASGGRRPGVRRSLLLGQAARCSGPPPFAPPPPPVPPAAGPNGPVVGLCARVRVRSGGSSYRLVATADQCRLPAKRGC